MHPLVRALRRHRRCPARVVSLVYALLFTVLPLGGCADDDGPGPDSGRNDNQNNATRPDANVPQDATARDGSQPTDASWPVDGTVSATQLWDPADFDHVYNVGPGHPYPEPKDVPWESLGPSTLVRIHWRANPYRDKWVINTEATELDPLVVVGIPDAGRLPVISGDNATTRLELNYWNEERSVVKVGGSNLPADDLIPSWIYVESLDIQSARPAYSFTDESGSGDTYSSNAAAIHVEVGDHIHIRGCVLHDAGNGLFSGHGSSSLVIAGNLVYDNGISGSYLEHNSYTESLGITFEYNHYGPLRAGCGGNNLKDRSAGTVIRYNWIEAGNRQLDLVETDHTDLSTDPRYATTFVYGNILVEPEDAGNSQIIHYGGDGGDQSMYRKGTLHLYHNTIISTRSGNTTLLRLSTNDESADVRNNIIFVNASGNHLAICAGDGYTELRTNWLRTGWVETHESTLNGTVVDLGDNILGSFPGFTDLPSEDYTLVSGADCEDAGGPLAAAAAAHPVSFQYVFHQAVEPRPDDGAPDLGALER